MDIPTSGKATNPNKRILTVAEGDAAVHGRTSLGISDPKLRTSVLRFGKSVAGIGSYDRSEPPPSQSVQRDTDLPGPSWSVPPEYHCDDRGGHFPVASASSPPETRGGPSPPPFRPASFRTLTTGWSPDSCRMPCSRDSPIDALADNGCFGLIHTPSLSRCLSCTPYCPVFLLLPASL